MTRRSTPQWKLDEAAYPIRVKFVVPCRGLGLVHDRMTFWLSNNIGRNRYAIHPAPTRAGHAVGVHFRTLDEAQQFVAQFPELEIADGVASPTYYSP